MLNPPCKDCEFRHDLCHSHCRKYMKFKKQREEELRKQYLEGQLKQNLYAIAVERSKAAQNKARDRMKRRERG